MRAFWDKTPCSLVGTNTERITTLTMETVRISETAVYSSEPTRSDIPEASDLHIEVRT
jgi:hypothetical protein